MSVIIRLQGLPWSASAMNIRHFFSGLNIPAGGVHIIGGDGGDAFIAFSSDDDARMAMKKNMCCLNDTPIQLFLSSKAEMQSVIDAARSGVPSQAATSAQQATPLVAPDATSVMGSVNQLGMQQGQNYPPNVPMTGTGMTSKPNAPQMPGTGNENNFRSQMPQNQWQGFHGGMGAGDANQMMGQREGMGVFPDGGGYQMPKMGDHPTGNRAYNNPGISGNNAIGQQNQDVSHGQVGVGQPNIHSQGLRGNQMTQGQNRMEPQMNQGQDRMEPQMNQGQNRMESQMNQGQNRMESQMNLGPNRMDLQINPGQNRMEQQINQGMPQQRSLSQGPIGYGNRNQPGANKNPDFFNQHQMGGPRPMGVSQGEKLGTSPVNMQGMPPFHQDMPMGQNQSGLSSMAVKQDGSGDSFPPGMNRPNFSRGPEAPLRNNMPSNSMPRMERPGNQFPGEPTETLASNKGLSWTGNAMQGPPMNRGQFSQNPNLNPEKEDFRNANILQSQDSRDRSFLGPGHMYGLNRRPEMTPEKMEEENLPSTSYPPDEPSMDSEGDFRMQRRFPPMRGDDKNFSSFSGPGSFMRKETEMDRGRFLEHNRRFAAENHPGDIARMPSRGEPIGSSVFDNNQFPQNRHRALDDQYTGRPPSDGTFHPEENRFNRDKDGFDKDPWDRQPGHGNNIEGRQQFQPPINAGDRRDFRSTTENVSGTLREPGRRGPSRWDTAKGDLVSELPISNNKAVPSTAMETIVDKDQRKGSVEKVNVDLMNKSNVIDKSNAPGIKPMSMAAVSIPSSSGNIVERSSMERKGVPFDEQGVRFEGRGPGFNEKRPGFSNMGRGFEGGRGPEFEQRGPGFEGRGMPRETGKPDFETRDRGYGESRPGFEDRGPGPEYGRPSLEGRDTRFEPRGPLFDRAPPDFEGRNPDFEGRGPAFVGRGPAFEGRGPGFEERGPGFEGRGPGFEGRGHRLEERGLMFEGRRPGFEELEDRGLAFDERDPGFERRGPGFEGRGRGRAFDGRGRGFEGRARRPNFEGHGGEIGFDNRRPDFEHFDDMDIEGRDNAGINPLARQELDRRMQFEGRQGRLGFDDNMDRMNAPFEGRRTRFESQGPNFEGRRVLPFDSMHEPDVDRRENPDFGKREFEMESRGAGYGRGGPGVRGRGSDPMRGRGGPMTDIPRGRGGPMADVARGRGLLDKPFDQEIVPQAPFDANEMEDFDSRIPGRGNPMFDRPFRGRGDPFFRGRGGPPGPFGRGRGIDMDRGMNIDRVEDSGPKDVDARNMGSNPNVSSDLPQPKKVSEDVPQNKNSNDETGTSQTNDSTDKRRDQRQESSYRRDIEGRGYRRSYDRDRESSRDRRSDDRRGRDRDDRRFDERSRYKFTRDRSRRSRSRSRDRYSSSQKSGSPRRRSETQSRSLFVKNMPLTTNYREVRRFFQPFDIPFDGLKLINDEKGNRKGIAYVQLRRSDNIQLALKKNGQKMESNIVSVTSCTDEEFLKAVDSFVPAKKPSTEGSGTQPPASQDKEKPVDPNKTRYILQLKNLPLGVTKQKITDFLQGVAVNNNGQSAYIEYDNSGDATGNGFVEVKSDIDYKKSLTFDGSKIGDNAVRVLPGTPEGADDLKGKQVEMLQRAALRNAFGPKIGGSGPRPSAPVQPKVPNTNPVRPQGQAQVVTSANNPRSQAPSQSQTQQPQQAPQAANPVKTATQEEGKAIDTLCVHIQGLPLLATPQDIRQFFTDSQIALRGINIAHDNRGKPLGEGFVEFKTKADFDKAVIKDKTSLGRHIVAVKPISKKEMQDRLGSSHKTTEPSPSKPDSAKIEENVGQGLLATPVSSNPTNNIAQQEGNAPAISPAAQGGPQSQQQRMPIQPLLRGPPPLAPRGAQSQGGVGQQRMANPQHPKPLMSNPMTGPEMHSPPMHPNKNIPPGVLNQSWFYVRCQNFPPDISISEILHFFQGFRPLGHSIRLHYSSDGNPTGNAVVGFAHREEAERALDSLNMQTCRQNVITLYPA